MTNRKNELKINWAKEAIGKIEGRLGQISIFGYVTRNKYNPTIPEENRNKIHLFCSLPGIKQDLGFFDTVEEAESEAERLFKKWLTVAELL